MICLRETTAGFFIPNLFNSLLKNSGVQRKIILGTPKIQKTGGEKARISPEMPVSHFFGPMPFGFSEDC